MIDYQGYIVFLLTIIIFILADVAGSSFFMSFAIASLLGQIYFRWMSER